MSRDGSSMKPLRSFIKTTAVLLFWILVWEAGALLVSREVLLPSPIRVLKRLVDFLAEPSFYQTVFLSLLRILCGFAAGAIAGFALALLAFFFRPVEILLSPLFTTIRATPVASFIILALVWIGRSSVPTFTSFLMVLPIVYENTYRGFASTDRVLVDAARVFNCRGFNRLKFLYLPSAAPAILSGVHISFGLAWKSGVAAEVLCSLKYSIGGEIYYSKLYLESVDLMAWTLTVIVLSLAFEAILSQVSKKINQK